MSLFFTGATCFLLPLMLSELATDNRDHSPVDCEAPGYRTPGAISMVSVTVPVAFLSHAARFLKLESADAAANPRSIRSLACLFFMCFAYLLLGLLVAFAAKSVGEWHEYYYCEAHGFPKEAAPSPEYPGLCLSFAISGGLSLFAFYLCDLFVNEGGEGGKGGEEIAGQRLGGAV